MIQQCKNLCYTRPVITIVTIFIIFSYVASTLPWNPEHFASRGWSCRNEGQHGTNPGHPGKSGTGVKPFYKSFAVPRVAAWLRNFSAERLIKCQKVSERGARGTRIIHAWQRQLFSAWRDGLFLLIVAACMANSGAAGYHCLYTGWSKNKTNMPHCQYKWVRFL